MRPSCSASIAASSACTISSSAAIWRRSAGSQAFLSSARSSSRCISREIVIVVSLTFVKDDIAGHGEAEGSSIAGRDRRRRRVGEPKCAAFWGCCSCWTRPVRHGTLGRTEQPPPLRMAPEKPKAGSMPAPGFINENEKRAPPLGGAPRSDQASRFGRFQMRAYSPSFSLGQSAAVIGALKLGSSSFTENHSNFGDKHSGCDHL